MNVAVCMDTTLKMQDRSVEGIRDASFQRGANAGYVTEADSIAALHFAFSLCGQGDTVTAVSYGGEEKNAALAYAFACGVTSLVRLEDQLPPESLADPMATAQALASWLRDVPFDVVVCGNPSGVGAMPAMLAGLLDVPCISRVYAVEKNEHRFDMQQRLERGWRQQVSVTPPVLVTVQAGFFSPMYVSVKRRRAAEQHAADIIETIQADAAVQEGVVLQSVNAPKPRAKRKAMPASGQSASNRLQSLMGGRGGRKSGKEKNQEDEETVREAAPEEAAQEIIDFLRKKELLPDARNQ